MHDALTQAPHISEAGCLLLTLNEDKPYVLLAKDKYRRAYGVLAGKRQRLAGRARKVLETPYQTALREACEESRGYWDVPYLQAHSHASLHIERGHFMLFRALVPRVAVATLKAQHIPRFAPAWAAYREISDYAWLSTEAIMQSPARRVPTDDGRHVRVHKALAQELKTAEALGWW